MRNFAAGGSHLETTSCLLCNRDEADPFLESRVQLAPLTGEVFRFVKCRACGLVYLNPRPSTTGMARYYPPEYLPFRGAGAWGRWSPLVSRSERRMDRMRVRQVTRRVGLSPETPVLDVGCGRPTFLEAVQRMTRAPCVGIDPSDSGWTENRQRWKGLKLLEGTAADLHTTLRTSAPAGFSVITLWHALEHEHDPLALLKVLRGLAAPGALLLLEVPDLDSIPARLQKEHWGGLHTPRHTAAYTPETLEAMVREAGWTVEEVHRRGTLDPFVPWWLGRQAKKARSLSGSLAHRFPAFVAGKALTFPLTWLGPRIPLGVQLAVARSPGS
jgi:2-polyprenyl-3-methyl-5-hydroxy-6-metoxy-1,4-benzoquinol methylase